jgi:hypothetical protein
MTNAKEVCPKSLAEIEIPNKYETHNRKRKHEIHVNPKYKKHKDIQHGSLHTPSSENEATMATTTIPVRPCMPCSSYKGSAWCLLEDVFRASVAHYCNDCDVFVHCTGLQCMMFSRCFVACWSSCAYPVAQCVHTVPMGMPHLFDSPLLTNILLRYAYGAAHKPKQATVTSTGRQPSMGRPSPTSSQYMEQYVCECMPLQLPASAMLCNNAVD